MKIERQRVGTVDVLTPAGPLVDQDGEKFIKTLLERLNSTTPRVVLAMQEVPYMDSVALDGLLTATEKLNDQATALKLANLTPTCREILELTGLSGRFRLFTDVSHAVKSFL
jgi:anti-anti-sigma factor